VSIAWTGVRCPGGMSRSVSSSSSERLRRSKARSSLPYTTSKPDSCRHVPADPTSRAFARTG